MSDNPITAAILDAHSRACAAPPSPIDAILARATLTPLDWLQLAAEALDEAGRLPVLTHERQRAHLQLAVEALATGHECELVAARAVATTDPALRGALDELADALEVVSGYRDLALRGGRGPSDDDLQRLATARARVAELEVRP